jgi:hypothetical protein
MRTSFAAAVALLVAASARATALTSLLLANEKTCFYADVDGVGEKIGEWSRVKSNAVGASRQLARVASR